MKRSPASAPPNWPGLCRTCLHSHRLITDRGSEFWRCRLSEADPRFARYPALPVLSCAGHRPKD